MVAICNMKTPFVSSILLCLLLFSCSNDAELLSEYLNENEKVAVVDDNFRIPFDKAVVLDVLSNDIHIPENTKIVETTSPSNGSIKINQDNTITYSPKTATTSETAEEAAPKETATETAPPEETSSGEGTTTENSPAESGPEETNSQEPDTPSEDTQSQETTSQEPETPPQETESQETPPQETPSQEAPPQEQETPPQEQETPPQEAPSQEQETPSDEGTPDETTTEEQTTEEPSQEETSSETQPAPSEEEEETTTENSPSNTEDSTEEPAQEESQSTEESSDEGNPEEEEQEEETGEVEEDTFTYTTETENEDGTVTTETGTVTVEVESPPAEEEPEPLSEPETEPNTKTEYDYWRDPVMAGSRLLDEKYYDLDTGEIYSKEVNLQRGQVTNYVEHENCPQRIKDKWENRVDISPSDVNGNQNGLQEIFNAHPRGTLFYLRAGVYQDQKNAVLENDQDVVGAFGAILDGSGIQGNSEASTRAIRSMERGYICNLKVRGYPTWNDPQNPRNPRGAALETIQGAILNCDVHSQNKGLGLIYGSKAMWNKVTAGRLGMYGYGSHDPNSPNRRGSVVKYNELYDCNFNGYDGEHEAGGAKFVQVDGTLWSHNYIHDIPSGAGIWQDGDNRDAEIYNNVIIKSHRAIFCELSHRSNMHHNTIEYGTGFGAIYMSNAEGEKAHYNFIRWCRNGITVRDKERGKSKIYPGQAWRGKNNEIYGNHIWQRPDKSTWTHGVAGLFDGHIDPNNTSNRWHDNHYYVDDNAEGAALFSEDEPFALMFMYSKLAADSDHITISWEEWKKRAGEENSTLEYVRFF